ncbi:TPA: hypothetical protein ACGOR8_001951 [Streptococcus suis]
MSEKKIIQLDGKHVEAITGYRAVVKYDRDFPRLFDLGDLEPQEENIIYSILGELVDRDKDGPIVFSYSDIAYMAAVLHYDNRKNRYIARTGKDFDKTIEELQRKLKSVSYKVARKFALDGRVTKYDDFPLFTDHFSVDHERQEFTLRISSAVYQEEIFDESGNVIQERRSIKDLFNNENWSGTKYLRFGREFHNLLKSKYSKRLYRFLSEHRTYGKRIIDANTFEKVIMKFTSPYSIKNKLQLLNDAVKELSSFTNPDGRQWIRDLEYSVERKNRKIIKYSFTFRPFTDDLGRIVYKDGQMIDFDTRVRQKSKESKDVNSEELEEILELFKQVFGEDGYQNNSNNRKYLKECLIVMDKRVVEEPIKRAAVYTNKTFGWCRTILESWKEAGVRTWEDLKRHENKASQDKSESFKTRTNRPYEELFTGPNWKEDYIGTNIPQYAQVRKYTKEEKAKVEAFKKHVRKSEYTLEDYKLEEEMYQEFLKWGALSDFEFKADFYKHDEWIEVQQRMANLNEQLELNEKGKSKS